jgi:hypothetical protein
VSDEVNLYLFNHIPYSGREFKIVSIASSILSAATPLALGKELYFDARVIELGRPGLALAYYLYRARVGLNNYVSKLYTGLVSKETKRLGEMLEELRMRGVGVSMGWRSTGTCIYTDLAEKVGFNPLTSEKVIVMRRVTRYSGSVSTCLNQLSKAIKSKRYCNTRALQLRTHLQERCEPL